MLRSQIRFFVLAGVAAFSLGGGVAFASGLGMNLQPSVVQHGYYIPAAKGKSAVSPKKIAAARSFVENVADSAISFLSDTDLSQSGKTKKFQQFLRKNFDLKTMGKYALGRYWRVATPAEKKEYLALFEQMILDLYSGRFNEYSDQRVEVISAIQKGRNVLVHSKIVNPSGSDIKLDWVVTDKSGSYKVIDVLVEGVSMVITQRSDFSSVIQRGGGKVKVLINHLKK